MSSPTKRRSQRTSASATPRRSARGSQIPPSSPAPARGPEEQLQSEATQASQRSSQATPRNSRLQTETSTQSPLFFRSSPVNGSGAGNGTGVDAETDGDRTPRASGAHIGGTSIEILLQCLQKV